MNCLLSMVFAISLVCSSASANSLETVYPQKDSIELRLEKMIEKYGKKKGKLIAEGRVWPTISLEMAKDAWGEPEKKEKSELRETTTEKWIYPNGRYLYFKNGRLESWRD